MMHPGHRYYPKTTEQKLGYLAEEAGEVLAAVGKSQRWGLESSNPELPPEKQETNRQWLLRELQDLKGAIAMIEVAFGPPPQPTLAPDPHERRPLAPPEPAHFADHAQQLQDAVNDCACPECHSNLATVAAPIIRRLSFSARNRKRCESAMGFKHSLHSWSFSDWFMATTGEFGEAGNVAKKIKRYIDDIPGNKESREELEKKLALELGDAACYLDLLAQSAGLDIDACREASFQSKSKEIGYVE